MAAISFVPHFLVNAFLEIISHASRERFIGEILNQAPAGRPISLRLSRKNGAVG
jgi:hypothetical protein